jgi:hypothetical protein
LKPNKIRYLETKGRSRKKAKRATKDLKKKEANLLRWRYLFWGICRTSRRKNKKAERVYSRERGRASTLS